MPSLGLYWARLSRCSVESVRPNGGSCVAYSECPVVLMERVTVGAVVDGDNLVPPAVDVLQPQQQAVAHLMEILQKGTLHSVEHSLKLRHPGNCSF